MMTTKNNLIYGGENMEEKQKLFTKGNIIIMLISILISIILSVIIIVLIAFFNSFSLVNSNSFKVDSFTLNAETTDFAYSDNYTNYEGEGIITCWDKNNSYYVLIEETDEANNKTNYSTSLVCNGEGKIFTYDTTASEKINKPNYKFKVIGFIKFDK